MAAVSQVDVGGQEEVMTRPELVEHGVIAYERTKSGAYKVYASCMLPKRRRRRIASRSRARGISVCFVENGRTLVVVSDGNERAMPRTRMIRAPYEKRAERVIAYIETACRHTRDDLSIVLVDG